MNDDIDPADFVDAAGMSLGCYIRRHAELTAANAALQERVKSLTAVLGEVLSVADKWCEAVSKDASWDSWDSHYKAMKYEAALRARAVLEKSQ